jgi:hypothetical protein
MAEMNVLEKIKQREDLFSKFAPSTAAKISDAETI